MTFIGVAACAPQQQMRRRRAGGRRRTKSAASVERVAELADKHEVPRVHIALAWLLQKKPVAAPIIGATKITHLEAAVGALSVTLAEDTYLEEPYVPHPIVGHQ
jgi:1-deoxyxylulose-5-phosphate synthase